MALGRNSMGELVGANSVASLHAARAVGGVCVGRVILCSQAVQGGLVPMIGEKIAIIDQLFQKRLAPCLSRP